MCSTGYRRHTADLAEFEVPIWVSHIAWIQKTTIEKAHKWLLKQGFMEYSKEELDNLLKIYGKRGER